MKLGLTVFCTVSAILLFYDTLFGRRVLQSISRQMLTAVQPILYGALIAYLLAPVVNFFERTLFPGALEKARRKGRLTARAPGR